MSIDKTTFDIIKRRNEATGNLAALLEVFGDEIARRYDYKKHSGIDAIYFYLVERYKWKPSEVKALNIDDLLFLLEEEQAGWTLPEELR